MRKVLYQLGNISYEEIQKIIKKISPYELESTAHGMGYNFNPNNEMFADNSTPDKNLIKEAFKFYGKRYIEEIKNLKIEWSSSSKTNSTVTDDNNENECLKSKNFIHKEREEEDYVNKLLMIKLRLCDELFLNYKFTEEQMRYLLYEYQMFDDSEVRRLFDEMNYHAN
jgi:hypothetical protein